MSRLAIFAILSACNATTAKVAPIVDDDDDITTDLVAGDDDDDDDDDDVTTTPYEIPNPTWFISGTLSVPANAEVPAGDVTVVLIGMTGDFEFGEVFRQVDVGPISAGGSVDYEIGIADQAADSWYWNDTDEPDMEVAVFSLGAYIDEDGDGLPTEADTYVSAAQDPFIAHLRGTLGGDIEYEGGSLGWNYVENEVISPIVGDFDGMDSTANLLPTPPDGRLGCEIIPSLDSPIPGNRRVDLFAWTGFYAGPMPASSTLVSLAVPDNQPNFQFDFPALGAPPDDHLSNDIGDGPMDGIDIAAYLAIAYIDADGDGAWSGDPYVEAPLATNDSLDPGVASRILMYIKATGFEAGYIAPLFDGLGWVLFEEDPYDPYGDITPLEFSDGLVLYDSL